MTTSSMWKSVLLDFRRRRVFQVMAVYAAVAWLTTQILDVALPALLAPDWAMTAVVTLAILGFPIAAILAWLFEASSDGVVRTRPGSATGVLAISLSVLLLIGGTGLFTWVILKGRPVDTAQPLPEEFEPMAQSIAVLPFDDMSADQSNEFFADGISEVLIHQLSQVKDLQVIARNSSFAFKGKDTSIRDVGRELNVESVLEGSVQRAGGKLRISVQLIDSRTDTHIWSKMFDRDEAEVFSIQDEIAQAVASEISATIGETNDTSMTLAPSVDLSAYELYLLGRHKLSVWEITDAVDLFGQAVAKEPDFALAHAGVAEAYLAGAANGVGNYSIEESVTAAKLAIENALALDPDLAEAQAAQILYLTMTTSFGEIRSAYEKAIASNSSYVKSYIWYASSLIFQRQIEEAKRVLSIAESLDPLNQKTKNSLVYLAMETRDFERANVLGREMYRQAGNDVDVARALQTLAAMEYRLGAHDRSIAYREIVAGLEAGDVGQSTLMLAGTYFEIGDFTSGANWLDNVPDVSGNSLRDWTLMLFYLQTGDVEQYRELLQNVIEPFGKDPAQPLGNFYLAMAVFGNGMVNSCDRAIELAQSGQFGNSGYVEFYAYLMLARCYDQAGDTERKMDMFGRINQWAEMAIAGGQTNASELLTISSIHAVQGNREEMLDYLEQAYEEGYRNVGYLAVDPTFEGYRDEERYQAVVNAMTLDTDEMRRRVFRASSNDDWFGLVDLEPREWMRSGEAAAN